MKGESRVIEDEAIKPTAEQDAAISLKVANC